MNKLIQTTLATLACLSSSLVSALPASDYWAVLVAGSKGFYNYRHQADVCHAYHLIKSQGIPEDQIIVMLYNDVAWDSENPYPGTLYNKQNGKNYYEGCKIDYHGDELTKENFFAILKGDSASLNLPSSSNSTRKVLKSNENSKVFLYFSDHGAPGHIMFPGSVIYADELNQTFRFMHANKMYDEFVVFLEACESGSMFQNMRLEDINVWALTATNATSPSYGTYCFPHDAVNDQNLYTCLGDMFSVSWMEYLEKNERLLTSQTLHKFYHQVKAMVSKSPVQHFGSLAIQEKPIASVFEPSAALSRASPFAFGSEYYEKFLSPRRLKEEERDVV